jgi:7-cyano-7-deazaguanine synthase
LAAWQRPAGAVVVDYGQLPAQGERTAAHALGDALGLDVFDVAVDCRSIGGGLLADGEPMSDGPSPEWWPFRNQLIVTVAASFAIRRGFDTIVVGTVASDGERHVDGTQRFYENLDRLVAMQEGGLRVATPAIGMSSDELLATADICDKLLIRTHSCHVSNIACGTCPGCEKRQNVLARAGRLQPRQE